MYCRDFRLTLHNLPNLSVSNEKAGPLPACVSPTLSLACLLCRTNTDALEPTQHPRGSGLSPPRVTTGC